MTTTKADKTAAAAVNVTVETEDGNSVMLLGADVIDKTEVEGKPFDIVALKNEVSATSGALGVWFEVELEDGTTATFNDYGKGMRAQIDPYLESIGKAGVLDEWIDLPKPIHCPRGVRISRYEAPDSRGKMVPAKTAYLTTSGGRK